MSATRVKMTQEALSMGMDGTKKRRTGILMRCLILNGNILYRIRRDGLRYSETWNTAFWESELSQEQIVDATLEAFAKAA